MKLKIMGVLASVLLIMSAASANTCILNEITLDSTVSGSWNNDCNSTHRDGSYAQYYTFTLAGEEAIKIDLTSDIDTYLYLLEDANTSGILIESNDDGGDGLNSRIIRTLSSGTYTIEATTFSAGNLGDFNLSLAKSTAVNHSFKGTIALPAQVLTLLESCEFAGCPSIYVNAEIYNDGNYLYEYAQVDYNDSTGKYEYQFNVVAEVNTSIQISTNIGLDWMDEATGEPISYYLYYSFGADQALGGTGNDADYPIENCDAPTSLLIDLSTPLPIIEIDLSNYVLPIFSNAMMLLDNVPANMEVYLSAQTSTCQGAGGLTYYNEDGSRTLTIERLMDGYEYGLALDIYNNNTYEYKQYRLNDDDGDFTNGGVFVEDFVYDEFTGLPVFDKMILATPEDINISAPENLNFGNPVQVPLLYLLLM